MVRQDVCFDIKYGSADGAFGVHAEEVPAELYAYPFKGNIRATATAEEDGSNWAVFEMTPEKARSLANVLTTIADRMEEGSFDEGVGYEFEVP